MIDRYRIIDLQHPPDLKTLDVVHGNAEFVLATDYDAAVKVIRREHADERSAAGLDACICLYCSESSGGAEAMSDIDLKPCPFCGRTNVSIQSGENYSEDLYEAGCWDCDVWITQDIPENSYSRELTEKGMISAINNWNRRAEPKT
jgi:Lar family restriction alleviation protein